MEGYLTEIRFWGPTWTPRNWASCSGQVMPIASFNAVFSLIGTIYGGDGRTTFMLPDLRGRVAVGAGSGPGLTPRTIGAGGGTETVTLTTQEMPVHNHTSAISGSLGAASFKVSNAGGTKSTAAAGDTLGAESAPSSFLYNTQTPNTLLNDNMATVNTSNISQTVLNNGSSQSHYNMQPWQSVLPIICLSGIYPSRS